MTPLEKMIADAKICNARLKTNKNTIEPKVLSKPVKPTPIIQTSGKNWRNKSLSQKEIEDIKYFRSKGWCVSSTAMVVGVSTKTVRKYDANYRGPES